MEKIQLFESKTIKPLKESELPKTNIEVVGIGHDTNGNRVIKLKYPNSNAFSIQISSGSLPKTYRIVSGLKKVEEIPEDKLDVISKEVTDYIKEFGSAKQKKSLKLYEAKYKAGEVDWANIKIGDTVVDDDGEPIEPDDMMILNGGYAELKPNGADITIYNKFTGSKPINVYLDKQSILELAKRI